MISTEMIINFIKSVINANTKNLNFEFSQEITFFFKFNFAVCNISLVLIVVSLIVNLVIFFFFNRVSVINSIVKYLNMIIIICVFILISLKFYISLKIECALGVDLLSLKLQFYNKNPNISSIETYMLFSSSFGDAIMVLCLIVGIICLDILGSKNLLNNINNISIFFLFTFFILIMSSTSNLLIMFISFEFIFLPTIYFAFSLGYTKKIDSSSKMLIYWTLFGSFLVLSNLGYLFYQYKTLNYFVLIQKTFSNNELTFLLINFIIGFGIKVPVAPLHFWLLKVHVEAPTAFSIYLSGFLVKSALYCLYMFMTLFKTSNLYSYILVWVLYSLIIGTVGLARQVDIKKLIAWATVQEMSFILLFLILKQLVLTHTCILFMILHGLMSSYMFYLVDILQRRYKTRSLKLIAGVNLYFPELTKYIWFLILLFSGFPLTIKFFIEWSLVSLLLETNQYILLLVLFFINFLGVIFFCRVMFYIIYGIPTKQDKDLEYYDIQTNEKIILKTLSLMILSTLFIMYLIMCV